MFEQNFRVTKIAAGDNQYVITKISNDNTFLDPIFSKYHIVSMNDIIYKWKITNNSGSGLIAVGLITIGYSHKVEKAITKI